MNKTLKRILLLSLAANALLLLGVTAGLFSLGKPPAAPSALSVNPHSAIRNPQSASPLSPEAAKAAAAPLLTDDPATLRDRLRALGLPDAVVRAVVTASIKSRDAARLREIDGAALAASLKKPYWLYTRGGVFKAIPYTVEQMKERSAISREEQEQIKQVLGDDAATGVIDYSSLRAAQNYLTYSTFLPPEKAARLSDIDRDYSDLQTQMLAEMGGFRMPGDDAKLKLLEDEKQRDIQALLTPEEQAAIKLHDSATASGLQRIFAGFDGTEDEYKAIFTLENASNEKFMEALTMSGYGGVSMSEAYRESFAAQDAIESQIKTLLGDERYAEYQRAERQDYQSLLAAAQRFNLAPETVAQTYQVREDTATEAKRISDDKSLTTEQRKQAYAALTEQATTQIRANLGDEVGDAYIDNALGWLKQLPQGGTVNILSGGNVYVTPPRATKAGKKKR